MQIGMGIKFTSAAMFWMLGGDIMGVMWGGVKLGGDKIVQLVS